MRSEKHQEGAVFKVWLFTAFDSSHNWSTRTGSDPSTWIRYPAPNLNVCISASQDWASFWNALPKWAQETQKCWGSSFGSHKSHLYHMSFQVQIDTLSCFPVMPLDVLPSKSQKRVHAHIETSFWILQAMTKTVTAGKELDRTGRTQHTEKEPKNCKPLLLSGIP